MKICKSPKLNWRGLSPRLAHRMGLPKTFKLINNSANNTDTKNPQQAISTARSLPLPWKTLPMLLHLYLLRNWGSHPSNITLLIHVHRKLKLRTALLLITIWESLMRVEAMIMIRRMLTIQSTKLIENKIVLISILKKLIRYSLWSPINNNSPGKTLYRTNRFLQNHNWWEANSNPSNQNRLGLYLLKKTLITSPNRLKISIQNSWCQIEDHQ